MIRKIFEKKDFFDVTIGLIESFHYSFIEFEKSYSDRRIGQSLQGRSYFFQGKLGMKFIINLIIGLTIKTKLYAKNI